ncbi:carboxymethylenebutenolidase [Sporobolomyces koalae]|uniref:carboxymethylenebutenolidase n=1 Tax=Sporobolomyces koalae TaxID=500713 RepID=UPI00316C636B
MLISQTESVVETSTGPMTIYWITPRIPGYPNAKFPGVVVYSEIYQASAPVLRFANSIAAQGYICAVPSVYHEFAGKDALNYDTVGTDAGNAYKVRKLVSATDSDNSVTIDELIKHPNCTGRIATTGMCYGGHLAFRGALDPRVLAAVCYFPTDIHSASLGPEGDDTLIRASRGEFGAHTEVVTIFGTQDGHVPLEGRNLIREQLTNKSVQPSVRLTFLELQANHAFIRDEMSKGRFDAAISKVCFELLLETFGRTIARDLGDFVDDAKPEKLVC